MLGREQGLGSRIVKLEPPLSRQYSYGIFGRAFQDRN